MEVFTGDLSLMWLCLTVLFAVGETFFYRYRLIWLSVGCTGGLICTLLSAPLWVQITVAAVVSAALLFFTRNWVRRVRCEDAMVEISPEGNEENEKDFEIRHNRNVGDLSQDGASYGSVSQDCSHGDLFPGSPEGGDLCAEAFDALRLPEP